MNLSEEEDEETMEWEQEQLRRGGHRTPEPTPIKIKKAYKPAPSRSQSAVPIVVLNDVQFLPRHLYQLYRLP
jgi:hypothetical protein